METVRFVGLDVHANSIAFAVAEPGRGERASWRRSPNDTALLLKRLRRLGRVKCCYEAGPTGFGLQRALAGSIAWWWRRRPDRSRPVDGFNHISRRVGLDQLRAGEMDPQVGCSQSDWKGSWMFQGDFRFLFPEEAEKAFPREPDASKPEPIASLNLRATEIAEVTATEDGAALRLTPGGPKRSVYSRKQMSGGCLPSP